MLKTELKASECFLKNHLDLNLKQNIQLNRSVLGVPFLGFRVFPNHTRLLPQSRKRFSNKLREYEKNYYEGKWTERELIRHMQPLNAFTDAGDSRPFRRMVMKRFGVLS